MHPKMSNKDTVFYRGNIAVSLDFSAEGTSSDGAVLLLEKLERKHKLINYFSKLTPDSRHSFFIMHSMEKLLKQRVYMFNGYYGHFMYNELFFHDDGTGMPCR
jgi:hypothetical protein